ncbi:MAG: hypothetical protein JEZ00_15090 [Anaerolineaceae bacterium]|nr:hypothetical protein [Anaerolineaceae bacterium]
MIQKNERIGRKGVDGALYQAASTTKNGWLKICAEYKRDHKRRETHENREIDLKGDNANLSKVVN